MAAEQTTSTALVHNPATGEVLDLGVAETDALAAAVARLDDLRADLTDFEQAISAELLRRLDRRAQWTLRVGDPKGDVQYEITAPSPAAGTEAYEARALEQELAGLVERKTIDEDGAAGALRRTLTVTAEVPFGHDLDALAKAAACVDAIAGVPVRNPKAEATRTVVKAGIARLAKVDGTGRALERSRVKVSAPKRRAKVKAVWKDGRS